MPTYLVRVIDNHDLVGIFVARDVQEVVLIVDECTDPGSCEYVKLSSGGIMWTEPASPIPIAIPDDDDGGDPDPIPWADATFTEGWWTYFHGFSRLRWKRFFEPDPPRPPEPVRQQAPAKRDPAKVLPFKNRTPETEPD